MTEILGAPDIKGCSFCSLSLGYLFKMLSKSFSKPSDVIYVKCYANTTFIININSNSYGNDLAVAHVISLTIISRN